MGLTKIRLGDYFELYSEKCNIPNLTNDEVSGVNKEKEFFEPSNQVGKDTSNYKIVPPMYFACNLMHVGRDRVLPIALNHSGKNKIVSPAYFIFKIVANKDLLVDYFFILLKCSERDRYFWFNTDASIRDGMTWNDLCNVEIEVPSLPVQQKYVDVYNAMLVNQQSYERGLEDLRLTIDAIIDKFKNKEQRIPIRSLLQEVDQRNIDCQIHDIYGITMNKEFIPSVANLEGVDLARYKTVKPGQMALNLMHVGRDKSLPIAINKADCTIGVSPAYFVFDLKCDMTQCLPEYIVMWLSREESGRYCWYISDTSVRGGFSLEQFKCIEIPVPSIKMQSDLVEIYHALAIRKNLNEQLKNQIKDICPVLIKGSIEEGQREA